MVRFRPGGERSSTLEEAGARESVPIADDWSTGKGLALSSQEIAISSLRFAFARGGRLLTTGLCAVVAPLGETPVPSSACALDV